MNIEEIFKQYKNAEEQIFKYFGYEEDWTVFPLYFQLDMYWKIINDNTDVWCSKDTRSADDDYEGNQDFYVSPIYTYVHLPKRIYRGKDYTMILVDTQCDRNIFLEIFDNRKELNV